jgi:epoxide hydrolase 4
MTASPASLLDARRLIVPTNGLSFEVFEAGAGDRLALLLHGFPMHAIVWRHYVAPLVAKGYRVWAVNQRGYGDSSRPDGKENYGFDALTGDVAALIDASGARSVSLVGHDWGGFVAWAFAARRLRPIERLAVINIPHPLCYRAAFANSWAQKLRSVYLPILTIPGPGEWLLTAFHGLAFALTLRFGVRPPRRVAQAALEIYRDNLGAPGHARALLSWYRAAGVQIFTSESLGGIIDAPTLIIWGARDGVFHEACLAGVERYAPNVRIERLSGVSHWGPEDAPDEINALLATFL